MLLLEQLTQLLNNMKRTLSFFLSIVTSFVFVLFLFGATGVSAQGQCEGIISEDDQYFACCANDKEDSMSSCATYRTHVRYTLGRCNGNTFPNDNTYSLCCDGASSVGPNLNACLTYKTQKNTPSCTIITTDAQFTACCSGDSGDQTIENACDIYAATEVNTPPSGGTQTTTPGGSTTTSTGGSGGATGAAVGECSAIRFRSLIDILIWIKCVITGVLIPLIFGLATIFFLWNVTQFIRSSDNTAKKEEARQRMVWGILALFIMLSVWGIITILSNIFGISPTVPLLQTEVYLDPAKASK